MLHLSFIFMIVLRIGVDCYLSSFLERTLGHIWIYSTFVSCPVSGRFRGQRQESEPFIDKGRLVTRHPVSTKGSESDQKALPKSPSKNPAKFKSDPLLDVMTFYSLDMYKSQLLSDKILD